MVPLNAYLQEQAGAHEKGRLMATNNFVNMLGVILASGILWLFHDRFHWIAGSIILALGVVILIGAVYTVALIPGISLRFVLWCLATLLFRIRMEGRERIPASGPALIVSNHISFADSVLVGYLTPRLIRFLMWQPYYEIAAIQIFFRILHAIPVAQHSPKQTIRALRKARLELASGELVAIFPEGGITQTGETQLFERGFERIVDGMDVPIIPVHLEGLYGHPLSYRGGGLFRSWHRLWRPRVTIRVGEPIMGAKSPSELRQSVMDLGREDTIPAGRR